MDLPEFGYTLVDLTHTLHPGIPFWDDNCGFSHTVKLDYQDCLTQTKFKVQQHTMTGGAGTHIDSPCHCFHNGKAVDQIPLSNLLSPCLIVDVSEHAHERYDVSIDDIKTTESNYGLIQPGTFIMIQTGWEKFWKEPLKYRNNFVFPKLTHEAAEYLLRKNISGIGIDTLSPDRPEEDYPVHRLILGAKKYIVENVANLSQMPRNGAFILAAPLKMKNATESPIRLIGFIPKAIIS